MKKFTWCRSAGGYRWAMKDGRRVLVQEYSALASEWFDEKVVKVVIPKSRDVGWGPLTYEWTSYLPYDINPPLFRQFAGLADAAGELDPDRALGFARQHGHLTLHCEVTAELHPEHAAKRDKRTQLAPEVAQLASPYWENYWRRQCGVPGGAELYRPVLDASNQGIELGETYDLWQRNVGVLSKLVVLYDGLTDSDEPGRDRDTLESYIARELDGRVLFAIDWQGDPAGRTVTGHPALRPRDLLGFVWLQFARQVAGSEEFRRCWNCGEYFSLTRYGLTANQKLFHKRQRKPYAHTEYCTELCRKEYHYRTVVKPARAEAKLEKEPKPGSNTRPKTRRKK